MLPSILKATKVPFSLANLLFRPERGKNASAERTLCPSLRPEPRSRKDSDMTPVEFLSAGLFGSIYHGLYTYGRSRTL